MPSLVWWGYRVHNASWEWNGEEKKNEKSLDSCSWGQNSREGLYLCFWLWCVFEWERGVCGKYVCVVGVCMHTCVLCVWCIWGVEGIVCVWVVCLCIVCVSVSVVYLTPPLLNTVVILFFPFFPRCIGLDVVALSVWRQFGWKWSKRMLYTIHWLTMSGGQCMPWM